MLDTADTDIQTQSLETLNGTLKANGEWEITSNGQIANEETNTRGKVDYVIIQSKAGKTIDGANDTADQGLGLAKDKMATLEVRNLTRDYVNTSQVEFRVSDTKAPSVKTYTQEVEVGRLFKNVVATTAGEKYRSYTLANGSGAPITTTTAGHIANADTKALLVVEYDEPITDMSGNDKLKLRINGNDVAAADPQIVVSANDDLVNQNGTVVEASTFILDVTDLKKNVEHTLTITGTKDLNDNTQSPNTQTIKFKVVNEKVDVDPVVVPVVKELAQIADNAFDFVFDQPNVKLDKATLKVGNGTYTDTNLIEIADVTSYAKGTGDGNAYVKYYDVEDAQGRVIGTRARIALSEEVANANVFDDNKNQAIRTVSLENYKLKDQKGAAYSKELLFKKDKTAPTVVKNGSFATEKGTKLYIQFADSPFASPNGAIKFKSGMDLVVEMKEGNLNHATDEIVNGKIKVVSEADLKISNDTRGTILEIDLDGSTGLLNDGKLVKNAVYTVKFKDGDIKDSEEIIGGVADHEIKLLNLNDDNDAGALNEMAAIDVSVVVGEGSVIEGRVPQTKEGLIFTNTDVNTTVASNGTYFAENIKQILLANPEVKSNKIIVAFDGEVDKSVAENARNYTIDGKTLSSSTKINVYEETLANIDAAIEESGSVTSFVVIELEAGTIPETGGYDLRVANITNKSGKRMLPVDVTVELTDNTAPVLQKVEVRGDKQIQLTFDEALENTLAVVDANKNMEIRIDGAKYTIATIDVTGNIVSIELTSEIEGEIDKVKAEVTIKKAGGFMYITDDSALLNKAKEVKVTNK